MKPIRSKTQTRYEAPQTAAAMPMPEEQPAPVPEPRLHPAPAVDETPPEPWTERELKEWNNLQVAVKSSPPNTLMP